MVARLGAMYAPNAGLPKIADVAENNYCTSCGTCEAICPFNAPVVRRGPVDISKEKNNYNKVEIKTEALFSQTNPFTAEINPCVNCYACERVCPILDGFPVDEFDNIRFMKAAKSAELKGQDGAAVSQILKSLLEQGEIDCAFGVARNDKWETEIVTLTKPEDVVKIRGTKYTYQPIVANLRDIQRAYIDAYQDTVHKYEKVAMVGVPCQVHGSYLFRENFEKIKLIIGLICMESFNEQTMLNEIIPNVMGVDIRDVVKMNFHKGKFIVETTKETKEVPIKAVAPMARKGCHFCQDYTSYYADISVGSVGSPDGWSTVFVRTETGEKYLNKVKGLEYSTEPIFMDIIKKLANQKHTHNAWDWQKFLKELWSRDVPVRGWGAEKLDRIAKIPPPPPAAEAAAAHSGK